MPQRRRLHTTGKGATGSSGGGGGQQGGDTVVLGPEYGEDTEVGVGVAVRFDSLVITPNVGVGTAVGVERLGLGPVGTSVGVAAGLDSLGLGPRGTGVGARVAGTLDVRDLVYTQLMFTAIEDIPASNQNALNTGTNFFGTNPLLLRAETVPDVSANRRHGFVKWDLTGYGGDFTGMSFSIRHTFTNVQATAAGVTIITRSRTSDPWTTPTPNWNSHGNFNDGDLEAQTSFTIPGLSTLQVTQTISSSEGLSAKADWLWSRVTTTQTAASTALCLQWVSHDTDGNPLTVPHQAPNLDIGITT